MSKRVVLLAVALAAVCAASIAVAAEDLPWVLVATTAAYLVIELGGSLWVPEAAAALSRGGFGPATRVGLGFVAVLLLAGGNTRHAVVVGVAVSGLVVVLATAMQSGLEPVIRKLRRPPLAFRPSGAGAAPKQSLSLPSTLPAVGPVSVLICALGIAADCSQPGISKAVAGLAVGAGAALVPVAVVAALVARALRNHDRDRAAAAAADQVAALAPEVIIYFDATPAEVYQVRQWIEPVSRLGHPAAIVVRSYQVLDRLGATPLPVICTPYNGTIASLSLPDRVVALFPTHTGNNLAMIRRSETRTVFVGHGDSDKPDSVNPFARVYDEVWVAGPLGRRRYAEAAVGVDPDAVVEVGRPQVRASTQPAPMPPVVLYAPTWEGWGDDPHHSTVAQVGVALVAALTRRSDVRVRYRPHPLTGNRSPEIRRAHQQIIALPGVELVPADEPIEQSLAGASGLVADVSSVISEWLGFDRPYAVADTRGLGSAAFQERFPSTAGGFVLGPDLGGMDQFVAATTGGDDPTAAARRALVLDALGDPATSQQRFAAAVERLLAR